MPDSLDHLTNRMIAFRDERNWQQFHNPKDVAISLSLEAAEVLEHFQWKTPEEVTEYLKQHRHELADELADVLAYVLLMAHDAGINLAEAYESKMQVNEKKYPVEKAKNTHAKHSDL